MTLTLLAVALAVHGLIHVVGFHVPWRLATVPGFAYATSTTWGRMPLSDAGAKVVGLGWLVGMVLFVTAGVGVAEGAPWALSATALAAVPSMVLCFGAASAARAGLAINAFILAVIVLQKLTEVWLATHQ